ncbi:cobalt-precorrin-5B (C(1))-methyltransferase [Flavobacterium columnare NBRC 100251 = ATCC 23463]|uniref:Cobalt-precorrin-5B C(1)-methyltransferase n=1 Tax=Flavobacterium columnare TaxID=996 RepID=A0AAI8GAG4_9FLAO|nr:cobalt-precorrin-5B (C(1))-methyltransferase [Flavobacterium columnare]AMO19684.1 cobalt-precorrin-5B (C(1))-methyltransferase [Flavobacterium columnare]ANO48890.1 cobalamin biosynthesis protein CbiD [Flavobacterium columnare]AUX17615.1 cobalamin biosynthesis protein CbiD [Flavobacterium columnare]MBF6653550.1 cobalt-precorrin-5B (C(1))-methyltransferase [Flavobacterium columnare]MBF6656468.1 cobalt-precorrin-5B (C(1))-methyltransferase [Flavobacterium columnare]
MSLIPIPKGPLRHGYTTGACATACAKAAFISLLEQREITEIEITLPLGEKVVFKMTSSIFNSDYATCTTIKDAGDDPDVTHGATIGCTISLNETKEIHFLQGKGVGVVTLPGLAIAVGEPAINPIPRKMITDTLNFIKHKFQCNKGVNVEVFVEKGEEIARKTLNSRIGILNGISILGTTGIVKAFSSSAYIASITQGIDVAIANGCTEIVINSGGRSENLLRKQFLNLPDFAFIQYGNWIGDTLTKINSVSLKKVTIGIMIGKAAKLAQGELDTHSGKSTWDKEFIYQMAKNCGYTDKQCTPVLELNMARRLTEIFNFTLEEPFFYSLRQHCYNVCKQHIPNVELNILLIDANDQIIGFN